MLRSSLALALILPLVLLGSSACIEPPEADLDGPTVVAATLIGPRSVEVSVVPELVVELSEPLDPASVHAGSVALIGWEPLESCALTPICGEGSCERGTCQRSPLRASDRSALDRGEFDGEATVTHLTLEAGLAGPDSRLVIRPARALDPHRRYSLVVGAGVRDRSGAPLVDDDGRVVAWQRDFVTAGRGSAGPEPRVVAPRAGQGGVPRNLAAVDTEFWPPIVSAGPEATLTLESDAGDLVALVDPRPCPAWPIGTCLRWRPSVPLAAQVRYRVAGGTIADRFGQLARRPSAAEETWFETSAAFDDDAPEASAVASIRGRCLAIWLDAGEPVEARLRVGAQERGAAIDRSGWIGLALTDPLEPSSLVAWSLELDDLAGNHAELSGALAAGLAFTAAIPTLAITEILANPRGPEPDAEFVEIQAGPDGAALAGVRLSDRSITEIQAAWASGELLGDPLPDLELGPEQIAVVVGSGYATSTGDDPRPPAGTLVIPLDSSLATGGLANAGEPLTLWIETADGPAWIAGYGDWIDPSPSAHAGRSVVVGGDRCDLPDRWASHPLGRASPGSFP